MMYLYYLERQQYWEKRLQLARFPVHRRRIKQQLLICDFELGMP